MDAVPYEKKLSVSSQRRQLPESNSHGSQLGNIVLHETHEHSSLARQLEPFCEGVRAMPADVGRADAPPAAEAQGVSR